MQTSHPKIVYNEECIDLRGNFQSTMNDQLIKKNENRNILWKETKFPRRTRCGRNEVVNIALKKLAKTYNSNLNPPDCKWKAREKEYSFNNPYTTRFADFQDANSLKSKSELVPSANKDGSNSKVVFPSSPVIQSNYEKGDFSAKVEPFQNKFTMTKVKEVKDETPKSGKRLIKDKSLEELIDKLVTEKRSLVATEVCHPPMWKDRRLMEKYSLLKVPWKRSYTHPVYLAQPSVISKQEFHKRVQEYSDKKTYLYDDGSDVDSLCYNHRNIVAKQYFSCTFQAQLLALLNISAYICALLVLSLIVWFVSGNKWVYKLLIPKPPEDPIKKYIKYFGGGIIYSISSVIRFIGRIFAIPTQQVFHPAVEYPWPP